MNPLTIRIGLYWFAALLPKPDESERDYYELLGLGQDEESDGIGNSRRSFFSSSNYRSIKEEEIRKAYKKKSLTLHPDKVLQRGGDPEQFQAEYQRVQEAYKVLSDPKKRSLYHSMGQSPTRYQFIKTGYTNPAGMYENLTNASFPEKSRIVFLSALVVAVLLVQPVLVCVKINQELEQSGSLRNVDWILVLIPTWVMQGLYVLLWCIIFVVSGTELLVGVAVVEQIAWFVGEVCVALRWDGYPPFADDEIYALVFVPIYVALLSRWTQRLLLMRRVSQDVEKMVTLEQLEQHIGKSYEDCTEEERKEWTEKYIVVHVPPDAEQDYDPVQQDYDPVQLSPEYEEAMEAYYHAFTSLFNGIVFGSSFMALLVLKLDELIGVSWWVVFIPWWISIGYQLLWNTYVCCFGSAMVRLDGPAPDDDDDDNDKSKETDQEQQGASTNEESTANLYAPVHGSARDFNQPVSREGTPTREASKRQPTSPPPSPQAAASITSNDSRPTNDAEETPSIDEETYRAWRSAYQEAESNATEASAKAQGNLCYLLFQLTIICLVVAKLQDDYPTDNRVGFNALWIIFPIFFLSGCAVCCCACLVYGAGAAGLDNLVDRVSSHDEENERGNNQEETPTRSATNSPTPTTTDPAAEEGTPTPSFDLD